MRAKVLAATLLSVLAGHCAKAQEANSQPEKDTVEHAETDVITVYGTSNPMPAFAYPGQVSVVSREDIELFNPSAISDVLRDLPGVEFSGGPRRTGETPSLRGLGGDNVLILLDGARQSFISAHNGRFFIDPALLRSAEVVRGPASALYGSGAVGGVLAFESVDAADLLADGASSGIRLHTGYRGANNESVGSITAFTEQGGLDLLASFGLRNSGNISLGSGTSLPSDDDIQTALVKAGFAVTPVLRVEGSWQHFHNQAFEPNNGQGLSMPGNTVLTRNVNKDITSDTYRFSAAFNPVQNDWIDSRITLYKTDSSVDEFDPTLPRTTLRDIDTKGVSVRNASRFQAGGVQSVLTLGGDWYRDKQVGSDDNAADGTRDGVPDGTQKFYGLFAQLEAAIGRPLGLPGDLLIIPGVRFDKFKSAASGVHDNNNDDAFSPRFAASYGPNSWFRVFGSYAEGFRAPSINELFLDGVHFSIPHPVLFNPAQGSFVFINNNFTPNPDLMPEVTSTIELGAGVNIKAVLGTNDHFQAKGSWYNSDVDDLINLSVGFGFDPACFTPPFFPCSAGTTTSANVASARITGFEAEALYESSRLRAWASYSSIDGQNKANGADLGILTPDRLNFDLRWKLPDWRASIGTRIQIANDFTRKDAAGTIVEARNGYTVVDIYASWKPGFFKGIRLDAGVDNIFDKNYERVFAGVSEPGFDPRLSISWQSGW